MAPKNIFDIARERGGQLAGIRREALAALPTGVKEALGTPRAEGKYTPTPEEREAWDEFKRISEEKGYGWYSITIEEFMELQDYAALRGLDLGRSVKDVFEKRKAINQFVNDLDEAGSNPLDMTLEDFKRAVNAKAYGIDLSDPNWATQWDQAKIEMSEADRERFEVGETEPLGEDDEDKDADVEATQLEYFKLRYPQYEWTETDVAMYEDMLMAGESPQDALDFMLSGVDPDYKTQHQRELEMEYNLRLMEMGPTAWINQYMNIHGEAPMTPEWLSPFVATKPGEKLEQTAEARPAAWEDVQALTDTQKAMLKATMTWLQGESPEKYFQEAEETRIGRGTGKTAKTQPWGETTAPSWWRSPWAGR